MNRTETATALADAFETRTRANGDQFTCLKDGSPEWMTDAVHAAHGSALPDDWIYQACASFARHLSEALDYDADADMMDAVSEGSDSLIPVYNNERARWLSGSLDRAGYVDDAIAEYGWPTDGGIYQAIAYGMQAQLHEIGNALAQAIEEEADDDSEEEEPRPIHRQPCSRCPDDCEYHP